jgi:predicted Zn finger-like uncharacterized protein
MIIQCEQCRTKFRLDDSRVKDSGVKVRCAKCKQIFIVRKELPETVPQPAFADLLERSTEIAGQSPPAPQLDAETESSASDAEQELAAPPFSVPGPLESATAMDSAPFEPPEEELSPGAASAAESAVSTGSEWAEALQSDKSPFPDSDSDLAGFDFAKAPVETDTASPGFSDNVDEFPFPTADAPSDSAARRPVFPDSTVAADSAEEKSAATKVIDVDSFSFDAPASAPAAPIAPLEQIPEESAAVADIPAAPPEKQKPAALPDAIRPEPAMAKEEELPPLSISTRRKQRPLVKVLLVVLLLAAAAALYFQYGSSLIPLITQKSAPEQGSITLRSIDASFVKHETLGELLIISGEAVNGYTTPRSSIQVKGVVYGDNNQILASKTAFSGNSFPKELLATMPLDKIEAAMANQFGGALENLEVAPGKALPFMIVITNLPDGAKNFGALPAGSTAVTKPKP